MIEDIFGKGRLLLISFIVEQLKILRNSCRHMVTGKTAPIRETSCLISECQGSTSELAVLDQGVAVHK